MAQHDYVIANQSGSSFRSDLNNALSAIVSQNSGSSEPSTTYAYQTWADTTAGVMKMRNGANSAWITLYQLDGEWSTIAFENGTAAAPSIYFKDSGTDTGFYSPGTDQVGISTGGTARLTIDASGNVNIDSNTLYVDAANNRVGLGTSSPSARLHVSGGDSVVGSTNLCRILSSGQVVDFTNAAQDTYVAGRINGLNLKFYTNAGSGIDIDSSGRLGIGTTPAYKLDVAGTVNVVDGSNGRINLGATTNYLYGDSAGNLIAGNSGGDRVQIDASGRLLVGTSSARANFYNTSNTNQVQIEGTNYQNSGLAAICNNTGTDDCSIISLNKSAGSSLGSNTLTASGQKLGVITFQGNDGTQFVEGAKIEAFVDGTSGADDMPGRLVFSTTRDGLASPTEALRISNTGATLSRTNSNAHVFSVYGDAASGFTNSLVDANFSAYAPNDATACFFQGRDTVAVRAQIRSNGGIANYSANNVNLSDRNAKKDIAPAVKTWDCLKEWEIVNFRYKDQPGDTDLNIGVIAQQVAESCPEVITVFQEAKEATEDQPAQEERLGVKDQQVMWMAIKALQEAQLRIETLEAKVAALEAV